MFYQLNLAIYNKEMGQYPIQLKVGIPAELARAILNVHVTYTKLLIEESVPTSSIPLLHYETDKIEKETKDRDIDGKGKVIKND